MAQAEALQLLSERTRQAIKRAEHLAQHPPRYQDLEAGIVDACEFIAAQAEIIRLQSKL